MALLLRGLCQGKASMSSLIGEFRCASGSSLRLSDAFKIVRAPVLGKNAGGAAKDKIPNSVKIFQWTLAGGAALTIRQLCFQKVTRCEVNVVQPPTTVSTTPSPAATSPFPWSQFLRALLPHILSLIVAVVSATAVAILNTKIGLSIGSIVNVLSTHLPGSGSQDSNAAAVDFIEQIKKPAWDVVKVYAAHAAMTFTYIYSLAILGKSWLSVICFNAETI